MLGRRSVSGVTRKGKRIMIHSESLCKRYERNAGKKSLNTSDSSPWPAPDFYQRFHKFAAPGVDHGNRCGFDHANFAGIGPSKSFTPPGSIGAALKRVRGLLETDYVRVKWTLHELWAAVQLVQQERRRRDEIKQGRSIQPRHLWNKQGREAVALLLDQILRVTDKTTLRVEYGVGLSDIFTYIAKSQKEQNKSWTAARFFRAVRVLKLAGWLDVGKSRTQLVDGKPVGTPGTIKLTRAFWEALGFNWHDLQRERREFASQEEKGTPRNKKKRARVVVGGRAFDEKMKQQKQKKRDLDFSELNQNQQQPGNGDDPHTRSQINRILLDRLGNIDDANNAADAVAERAMSSPNGWQTMLRLVRNSTRERLRAALL